MRFLALFSAALLTSACTMDDASTRTADADPQRLTEGTWVFESIAGQPIPDRARVTLEFDADEKRAFGLAACNRYTSGYTLEAARFSLQMMASTKMACPEPLMITEDRFFDALAKVTEFAFDEDGRLQLIGSDGAVSIAISEPQGLTE